MLNTSHTVWTSYLFIHSVPAHAITPSWDIVLRPSKPWHQMRCFGVVVSFPYRNRWRVAGKHYPRLRLPICWLSLYFFFTLCVFKPETVNSCKFMIDTTFIWKINSYNFLINLHEGQYQTIPTSYHGARSAFCYNLRRIIIHLWLARLEYLRIIQSYPSIIATWPSWPPPSHIYMLLAQVAPSNLRLNGCGGFVWGIFMVNSVLLWRCGGKHRYQTCVMRSKIVVFWFVLQGPSAYSLLSSHYDHSRLKGSIESYHNNPSFWYGPNNHREVLEWCP